MEGTFRLQLETLPSPFKRSGAGLWLLGVVAAYVAAVLMLIVYWKSYMKTIGLYILNR
jgi:hypothetical protein